MDEQLAAAEKEFDMCVARLGIDVPADLRSGVLAGYRGLRAMSELLRDVGARPDGPSPARKGVPGG